MNALEWLVLTLIVLSGLMVFYRLFVGPANADRLIAADTLSLIATIVLVLLAAIFNSPFYLDVALIYALLSFIGIIALAHVMENRQDCDSASTAQSAQSAKDTHNSGEVP